MAITLPLIPVFMILIGLLTRDRAAMALNASTAVTGQILDLIAGIPTLRALGRTATPLRRITELGTAQRRSVMATLRVAFLSAMVLEMIATLSVALIAVSIGMRLVFGHLDLTTALTVLILAPEVYWPLRRVGIQFHSAADGTAAADKAFELLDTLTPAMPGPVAAPMQAPPRRPTIGLEAISVLDRGGHAPWELTATIRPGAVTVLTGHNGAGKSTAHLDADTEAAVLAALVSRARQGATVVLVGHRAPVLAAADEIFTVQARHAANL
ncbi:thiol reductant ABC exporter, CydD subunit [Mycobacteroides abscessus subsp. massiliense]|nr:thiol reductant ABC exporter, CydD subunit [Mycobacteroides abscessus subsp. massiliense]